MTVLVAANTSTCGAQAFAPDPIPWRNTSGETDAIDRKDYAVSDDIPAFGGEAALLAAATVSAPVP